MTPEALFVRDGDRYVATELGLGPWYPGALHGGAPAALVARLLTEAVTGSELRLARLTYEFVRPVMAGALRASISVVRPGRRVTLLDCALRDDEGREVLHARGLFLAASPLTAIDDAAPAFPGPEEGRANDWVAAERPMFATHAIELRFVQGSFRGSGPAVCWLRLYVPVLAGETIGGVERIAAAGDFGNGIGSVLDWRTHSFINPDLTLYLERDPVDEWVALQSQTRVVAGSVAVAESVLWDRRGRIGHATQSLLVERHDRGPAAAAVISDGTP